MPFWGAGPPSPRRLLVILVIACAAPLGIGVLLDVSSDSGTLVLGSAATRRPVGSAPAGGAAGGEGEADGRDAPRSPGSGSTAAATPSTSTAGVAAAETTTTGPPLSTTAAPASTTAPRRDPTTTAAPASGRTETDAVVSLTNAARAEAGCPALVVDSRLAAAAQSHSDDMATRDYFSHTSPEGTTFADRARAAGYPQPGGENIAHGHRSATAVTSAWMDSPGHRGNILNCAFTAVGVGLDEGEWMWVQVFGY